MASIAEIVADNVRRERKARGLTQAELANTARVPQPRIAEIEAGNRDFRISTLERVAKALGVSSASLLIPADEMLSV